MPELPDLQVISKNLDGNLKGEVLAKIKFTNTKKLNADLKDYEESLIGKAVKSVIRDGKEVIFQFGEGDKLSFHLMREGKFFLNDDGIKHKIVELQFESGKYFAMNDFMGQAKASLNPAESVVPDALCESFTLSYLEERLSKKKASTLKGFLVDQNNVKGIGNAYADEILWEAKISPKTKCGKLPKDQISVLYECISLVLNRSEEEIRKIEPDIISGEIREFMKVHNKNITNSPTGAAIINEKISGKSTYYTSEQVLYE